MKTRSIKSLSAKTIIESTSDIKVKEKFSSSLNTSITPFRIGSKSILSSLGRGNLAKLENSFAIFANASICSIIEVETFANFSLDFGSEGS